MLHCIQKWLISNTKIYLFIVFLFLSRDFSQFNSIQFKKYLHLSSLFLQAQCLYLLLALFSTVTNTLIYYRSTQLGMMGHWRSALRLPRLSLHGAQLRQMLRGTHIKLPEWGQTLLATEVEYTIARWLTAYLQHI